MTEQPTQNVVVDATVIRTRKEKITGKRRRLEGFGGGQNTG